MKITKEMRDYAKEQMVRLLENMRHEPIQCYSSKERGKPTQYFLGRLYVDDLIKRIENSF